MSVPSPICTVDGIATPVDVTASATHEIELANITGAQFWAVSCTSTDETTTPAAVNATLTVNLTTKKATFTSTGAGTALIFTSTVGVTGLGLDANGKVNLAYTTTFKVNIKAANGNRVLAANETVEQNSSDGWLAVVNPLLRTGGAITLAGDVTGASNANTVVQLTGSSGVVSILAASLTWAATVSPGAPTITQTARTTDAATANIVVAPQAPYSLATTTNRTPGSFVVNLAAPTNGSTTEAALVVQRGGTNEIAIGQYPGIPGTSCIWLGLNGVAASGSNMGFYSNGTNMTFNAPGASGYGQLTVSGGSNLLQWTVTGINIFGAGGGTQLAQFYANSGDFVALGSGAAAAGMVRLPNNTGIYARNAGNTADLTLLVSNASNQIMVGDNTNTSGASLRASSYAQLNVGVGGTIYLDSNALNMRDATTNDVVIWTLAHTGATSAQIQAGVTSFTLSFAGTGPAAGTAASLTLSAQNGNGTNGTPGNVIAAIGAPTGSGTEPNFQVTRGGAIAFATGYHPGNSSFADLWLGAGITPNASNFVVSVATNSTTSFNAPGAAATLLFTINNTTQVVRCGQASGDFIALGANPAGAGYVRLANAGAINFRNAANSADLAALAVDASNNVNVGNTSVVSQVFGSTIVFAATPQGSANTQVGGAKETCYSGYARTTTNSAVTILTIPLATSGSTGTLQVLINARDVTAGTVGDSFHYFNLQGFKNVGGTVTACATQPTALKANDTSMATCAVTYTISTTNIVVQVTGLSAVTIDWTAEATLVVT